MAIAIVEYLQGEAVSCATFPRLEFLELTVDQVLAAEE
jgi:hypothetical protein